MVDAEIALATPLLQLSSVHATLAAVMSWSSLGRSSETTEQQQFHDGCAAGQCGRENRTKGDTREDAGARLLAGWLAA